MDDDIQKIIGKTISKVDLDHPFESLDGIYITFSDGSSVAFTCGVGYGEGAIYYDVDIPE